MGGKSLWNLLNTDAISTLELQFYKQILGGERYQRKVWESLEPLANSDCSHLLQSKYIKIGKVSVFSIVQMPAKIYKHKQKQENTTL